MKYSFPDGFTQISDYPRYAVSVDGQVWDADPHRLTHRNLLARTTDTPYIRVTLVDPDGIRRQVVVHRLIAQAYIPNPHRKPIVDHKDMNKHNNAIKNLEWVTYKENARRARAILGNWGDGMGREREVVAYLETTDSSGTHLGWRSKNFNSIKEAAEHFNKPYVTFAPQLFRAVQHGWKMHGYLWRFTEGRKPRLEKIFRPHPLV